MKFVLSTALKQSVFGNSRACVTNADGGSDLAATGDNKNSGADLAAADHSDNEADAAISLSNVRIKLYRASRSNPGNVKDLGVCLLSYQQDTGAGTNGQFVAHLENAQSTTTLVGVVPKVEGGVGMSHLSYTLT